jgi:hypothetical protein
MLHPANWFRVRLTALISAHYAPIVTRLFQRISELEKRVETLEQKVRNAHYFAEVER